MKICIATLAIGKKYQLICAPGTRSKRRYAKKHGYNFVLETSSLDPSRPPAWSKILLVEKLLPHYDWVFWVDADTVIMNDKIKLESLIDERFACLMCIQNNSIINSGVMLFKNTPHAFEFLKEIYSRKNCIHHAFWENQAIIEILNEKQSPYKKYIQLLPQKRMNSFHPEQTANQIEEKKPHPYEEEDFLIHFPGKGIGGLFFLMRKYGWKKPAFSALIFLAKGLSLLLGLFHQKGKNAYRYFQKI